MYDADPFFAQKEVQKRQAKAAEKREETTASNSSSSSDIRKTTNSNEFSQFPEIRMATSLRELVEDAIKEVNHPSLRKKTMQ